MHNINHSGKKLVSIFVKGYVNLKRYAEVFNEDTVIPEITQHGLIVPYAGVLQSMAKGEVIAKCLMRI